jgi:hypothetical protein
MRLVAGAIICLLLAVGVAMARPPAHVDPNLVPWFQGLKQPHTGEGCCSLADCRNVDARSTRDGFQALIAGSWVNVPRDAILDEPNPTGRPVACWIRSPTANAIIITILCFVPGAMI